MIYLRTFSLVDFYGTCREIYQSHGSYEIVYVLVSRILVNFHPSFLGEVFQFDEYGSDGLVAPPHISS